MKNKICFSILALSFLALPFAFNSKVNAANAAGDYSNIPEASDVSADSYYVNSWFDTVGSRRISDTGVIISDVPGWGYRGKIPSKKFDLKSFYFTFDVSNLAPRATLMLMMANGEGSYCNGDDNFLSLDIVKHSTNPNLYCMTVDTHPKSHAVSLPGFEDGTEWSDDGTYKGITLEVTDGLISFSVEALTGTTSKLIANGREFPVENDDLFALCTDSTAGYIAIGSYSNSGRYSFIINEIGDAAHKEYLESGDFYKVKTDLTELDAIDYSTASNDELLAAKAKFDALPYNNLWNWDKAYFDSQKTAVSEKINNALTERGSDIQLDLLQVKVEALQTATATLDSVEKVDASISAKDECDNVIEVINGLTLTSDQTTRFNGLKDSYNSEASKILTGIKAVYESSVAVYEAKANAGLSSGLEYSESMALMNAIPYKYNSYISASEAEAFDTRVQAASAKIEASTKLTHDNWIQSSNNAKVITTADNTLDLVSTGGSFTTQKPEDSNGLFLKEALNVLDFEVKFNVHQFPQAVGSWVTLGFMQNLEPWIHQDRDVNENTGIYFLLTKVDSANLRVEAHVCTIASIDFFDSTLVQTIKIPFDKDVTLKFSTEERTIAGVTDTYFNIQFNDVMFDQDVLTARKIKTAIQPSSGVQKGYFQVGSSGSSKYNPAVVSILSINGFSPLADSVAKAKAEHEAPTSTTTNVTFISGSQSGKATFNLDLHGEELVSVKVDNKDVAPASYTLDSNKLILKNEYCNTLSVGEHTVEVESTGGKISWKLTVVGDDKGGETPVEPEKPSEKKGCGGSIVATSAIISITSLVGAALLVFKKKEK